MADYKKISKPFVTPVGTLLFTKTLHKPEQGMGDRADKFFYVANIRFDEEDLEKVKATINDINKEVFGAKAKKAKVPFKDYAKGDDEFEFLKATSQFAPLVIDTKKNPVDPKVIWGGSKGRVSGILESYEMKLSHGLTFRLKAVQIVELVSGTSGGDGTDDFDEIDGFVAPTGEAAAAFDEADGDDLDI